MWIERSRQVIRFEKIKSLFDLSNKTLYDVGCGYGDFYFYLLENMVTLKKYSGIDLIQAHCDEAKKRLPPEVSIFCGDFLNHTPARHDVFVLSGALNFYEKGWLSFAKKTINKMWKFADEAIIFNIRSSYDHRQYDDIKPSFWCAFAERKTKIFSICHDYMKNDFTILMLK